MRARQSPVESLVTLPRLTDAVERRARWRQAIAALGQRLRVEGPPPLDDVDTDSLLGAARIALESGLVDDMSWIAPGPASVALYELTSALPPGRERRELGRRVFERLYEGTATTFAPVAARMALGSVRSLEAPTLRARVSLMFSLPVGTSVNADPLALTLVTRREQFERWVLRPSRGPLPGRCLAATLLEHACREAARRAQQGDLQPKEHILGGSVRPTFSTLLADREPLVWRHAAVARGLLAAVEPSLREEIDLALDPSLTPTEWRRAVVSLVACVIGDVEGAMQQCRRLLESPICVKDPGIPATLVWGMPRVIEAEPDAAIELLDHLSLCERQDVAENIGALLSDTIIPQFGLAVAERVQALLLRRANPSDPALQAMIEHTLKGLDARAREGGVQGSVRRALVAYETQGARSAHELALEALDRGHATMDAIEALSMHGEAAQPEVLGPLADLDASVLERSRLYDLLLLGRRPGDTNASVPEMERLYHRVGKWVLDDEERYVELEFTPGGALARQRKLRALLHLMDLETSSRSEQDDSERGVRARVKRSIRTLLRSIAAGPDAAVHRIFCATLARGMDAAVREGVADPSDLLLLVIEHLSDDHAIRAVLEASTNDDVREGLDAYCDFLGAGAREAMDSIAECDDPSELLRKGIRGDELRTARSFLRLSRGIGTNGSYRGEALRQVMLRIGRALEATATARSLMDLAGDGASFVDPIADLESAAESLRKLVASAERRVLDEEPQSTFEIVADVPSLSALVARAVTGVPPNVMQLTMATRELTADLPAPLATAISAVVGRLASLPVATESETSVIPLQTRRPALPDWLLPRKTIGGFYVVRALGSGGVSSVFVARRIEERREANAELYALKVPEYDPNTARSLTEQEFLQMFRDEASALLSLPQHPNLARFVTFDMAARPKPILVMELIPGLSLDRLIRNRSLTLPDVFRHLDGILAGLEAMHSVGVGHLDVKPTNVILRDHHTPVLVDFGLSGRQLRPGCGTLEYCAPEILVAQQQEYAPSPAGADIYAFACTAFELLTGELLFDAEEDMAIMSQHLHHDGWPPRLADLVTVPGARDLCVSLAACLRRDPSSRATVPDLRRALAAAAPPLADAGWPLTTAALAAGASA